MRKTSFIFYFISTLVIGGGIGWLDLHNDEVQWSVLFLVVFGGFLGLMSPRFAWLWGLILGLSIPCAYLVAFATGFTPRSIPRHPVSTLIALIPAFIGVYAGALMRMLWVAACSGSDCSGR